MNHVVVHSQYNQTNILLATCQVFFIILLAAVGGSRLFDPESFGTDTSRAMDGYNLYLGVMIMMLIGFGYLMTFMKYYGLGAVGFCLLVTAVGLQWGLLIEAFFIQWVDGSFGKVSCCILC